MPDLGLDLRYLRHAIVAAEQGSFRKAAQVLNSSQASISRRIQLLEHRLGFRLFERDHRGARLTIAGEDFLKEAVAGVTQFDRAVRRATLNHQSKHGHLRIGILSSVTLEVLRDILVQYRNKHDGVHITYREANAQDNLHRLITGQLDISFVHSEPAIPGFQTMIFSYEPLFVALPRKHRLITQNMINWEDVRDETFVMTDNGRGSELLAHLMERFAALGHEPRLDMQATGQAGVLALVALGHGLTLASAAASDHATAHVVFRALAGDGNTLPTRAVWSANNKNPALRTLLSLFKTFAQAQSV